MLTLWLSHMPVQPRNRSNVTRMYPTVPIKESMLLVNTTKTGSYDYLSKYGSDWLGHVTCLHNYYCYATPYYSIATPCNTTATPYISITTRCYTIYFYYYTVLHHTFLLLHSATPYISITTQCYTIHLYYYTVLHHTVLLLHGCYTIHFYYYTGAIPYISITTQVLHHTSLLLHGYYTTHLYCYASSTPLYIYTALASGYAIIMAKTLPHPPPQVYILSDHNLTIINFTLLML